MNIPMTSKMYREYRKWWESYSQGLKHETKEDMMIYNIRSQSAFHAWQAAAEYYKGNK